jgi:predicted CoA-binding protein
MTEDNAAAMKHDAYDDAYIAGILKSVRTIAVVGASGNPARPSYFVARYLIDKGYEVYPVNPGLAGGSLLGRPVFASLAGVPVPIDMVDIFRNVDAVPAIAEEILRLSPLPKVVWMQLAIRHDETARRLEAAGIRVVMNRCPKIEYGRLSGEIGWSGVNSSIVTARKPVLGNGVQKFGIRER